MQFSVGERTGDTQDRLFFVKDGVDICGTVALDLKSSKSRATIPCPLNFGCLFLNCGPHFCKPLVRGIYKWVHRRRSG